MFVHLEEGSDSKPIHCQLDLKSNDLMQKLIRDLGHLVSQHK